MRYKFQERPDRCVIVLANKEEVVGKTVAEAERLARRIARREVLYMVPRVIPTLTDKV